MLHQSHVIEEADAQHEHEDAQQIRKSTCTDRLQSRNGSRRVNNRRIINYIIAHNQQTGPAEDFGTAGQPQSP